MGQDTTVRIEELFLSFPHENGRLPIIDGLSLKLEAGEFVSLVGPSGCGKSTLLRVIDGLLTPDSGRVFIGDQEVVGVPEYQMTAVVWMKGILSEFYGVPPTDIAWFTGGQEEPGRKERMPLRLPPGFSVTRIADDQTLNGMLETGEIDALIAARAPSSFLSASPNVARLFPDPRTAEHQYFNETRIFPIMHTVVIRKDVLEDNPWVALSLYKAFELSQRTALSAVRGAPALRYSLAWLHAYLEEEERILGSDLWANGMAANRHVVEKLSEYLVEQGLIASAPPVEELFYHTTHEVAKI